MTFPLGHANKNGEYGMLEDHVYAEVDKVSGCFLSHARVGDPDGMKSKLSMLQKTVQYLADQRLSDQLQTVSRCEIIPVTTVVAGAV